MLFASRFRRAALWFPISMFAGAFGLSMCSMPIGRSFGATAVVETEVGVGGSSGGGDGGGSSSGKRARLCASRKQRIVLPKKEESLGISEFLKHRAGVEAVLNTRALQSYHPLDDPPNTYRCKLPAVYLLKLEIAPVIDLRVIPTTNDCTVEMLSCKFEGSKAVEQQNDVFTAFMRNYITWDANDLDSEVYMDCDVTLNITIEMNTRPFSFLPVAAVEKPGNLVMQGLVDRLIPQQVDQLVKDYNTWLEEHDHDHDHNGEEHEHSQDDEEQKEHEHEEQELLHSPT